MLKPFSAFGVAAMIALVVGFAGTSGDAQSVMKQCGDQWRAAKAAGTTSGQTWPQFLSQCRANLKSAGVGGAAGPAPSAQPAPAPAPAPTYGQAPATGVGKTAGQCDAEYAANKAAIRASGQTKRAFVAACRAGNETIPQRAAAAPVPKPVPATTPAPAAAPAPAPGAAPAPYASTPTPMGASEFASEQQARARCPSDTVVWVNTNSHVYHFAGTHNYGHTKEGAYMCEADAKAAGDRAAMNEHHP
jgi:pyruvate/2-oxoglutarate dehydrogenase complex dihydrolipoamide acyltransferase (E2) component